MTFNQEVPEWVKSYILCWTDRLHLEDWHIEARLELCVNDDPTVRAAISITNNVHHASIVFRADMENDPTWQRTVIHEMLHIKHEPICQMVREVILPELERPARRLADDAYRNAMEQFIDTQTLLLWRLAECVDNPGPVTASANGRKEGAAV